MSTFSGVQTLEDPERNRSSKENREKAVYRCASTMASSALVNYRECGCAFSPISLRSTARKIQYYRCIGSDRWRYLAGRWCHTRPVRQDLLDEVVWTEVLRLLEERR